MDAITLHNVKIRTKRALRKKQFNYSKEAHIPSPCLPLLQKGHAKGSQRSLKNVNYRSL